jgi:polysaccharide biosynthesis transport protein
VQLRALERESDANKTLLQQFLSRFEEISAQSDLVGKQTNARILSKAVVPEKPSEPKKRQLLALIFLAASTLAAALVLLVENMDRGFRSGDQIEESTGVRTLGLVPVLKGRRRAGGPQGFVVKNPSSLLGESIRSVYTSILISHAKPAPRTVLVTSSQPKEGKSTLAGCLTRSETQGTTTKASNPTTRHETGRIGKRGTRRPKEMIVCPFRPLRET